MKTLRNREEMIQAAKESSWDFSITLKDQIRLYKKDDDKSVFIHRDGRFYVLTTVIMNTIMVGNKNLLTTSDYDTFANEDWYKEIINIIYK